MAGTVPPEVSERLRDAVVAAHLATSHDDRPHSAPVWYYYDDGVVEVVTTGRKLRDIRANPKVALSVQQADDGIPEWTVTLHGTATVVDDADETRAAARRINRKYGVDPDAWSENTLVRVDVGSASLRTY